MRNRFIQNNQLDAVRIECVELDKKSRDSLPKLLAGLQYIYVTQELNEAVFAKLEKHIMLGKQKTGRPGMSLWEIFVMAMIRMNMELDYDKLQDQVNHHVAIRGILGVHSKQVFEDGHYYELQTIKDNISLLDEEVLKEINAELVKAGHRVKKKTRKLPRY